VRKFCILLLCGIRLSNPENDVGKASGGAKSRSAVQMESHDFGEKK